MCTVTYIPVGDSVFISSNRDEDPARGAAILPAVYPVNSGNLIFPKDIKGGSWIAAHENGNAIVLLNGAFDIHRREAFYRKSRGLILTELIDSPSPYTAFTNSNLSQIEPFTLVIYDNGRLFECRWDSAKKFRKQLDEKKPWIWSSATLYDFQIAEKRDDWFTGFLKKHPEPDLQQICNFHFFAGEGDDHNAVRMNRNGKVATVSVSTILVNSERTIFYYSDLQSKKQVSVEMLRSNLIFRQ